MFCSEIHFYKYATPAALPARRQLAVTVSKLVPGDTISAALIWAFAPTDVGPPATVAHFQRHVFEGIRGATSFEVGDLRVRYPRLVRILADQPGAGGRNPFGIFFGVVLGNTISCSGGLGHGIGCAEACGNRMRMELVFFPTPTALCPPDPRLAGLCSANLVSTSE